MSPAFTRLSEFLRVLREEESGQGTVEYILILSVTVTGVIALARGIVQALDKGILGLGGQLEKDLKTGRTSINAWIN